jgi:hypothetical protein
MKTLLMTLLLSATLTGGSIYDFKVAGLDGTDSEYRLSLWQYSTV